MCALARNDREFDGPPNSIFPLYVSTASLSISESIFSASWRIRVEIQAVSITRRTFSILSFAPGTGSS